MGDRSSAEDIAQESLARAYQRWTKIAEYRQAWATLRRRRATARAAGGVLCLAIATPAFLGATQRGHGSDGTGQVDATVAGGTTVETEPVDDIHGYQIEATGRNIAGAAVLVWDKNFASMNAILDSFRGEAREHRISPRARRHRAGIGHALLGDRVRRSDRVLAGALAFCRHRRYVADIPVAITIRNVPDDVRNELASRAAAKGWSLQEFVLWELVELTKRPDRLALLARIEGRLDGTILTVGQLVDLSDRERR